MTRSQRQLEIDHALPGSVVWSCRPCKTIVVAPKEYYRNALPYGPRRVELAPSVWTP